LSPDGDKKGGELRREKKKEEGISLSYRYRLKMGSFIHAKRGGGGGTEKKVFLF